jgi:hypothetical protein
MTGRTLCPDCAEKRSIKERIYNASHKEAIAATTKIGKVKEYAYRIENGICTTCGKRKAVQGMRTCYECQLKRRQRYYREQGRTMGIYDLRKEMGVCVLCGADKMPEQKLCKKCYEMCCDNMKKARDKINKMSHSWRHDFKSKSN